MQVKVKMSLAFATLLMFFLGMARMGSADQYGGGAITDLFMGLWNEFWPLVALFFLIVVIGAAGFLLPKFLKGVFGSIGGR